MKAMKRLFILVLLLAGSILFPFKNAAAQTAAEFFNTQTGEVTWLGIDFTEVRLFGDMEVSGSDIKERYIPGINNVVVSEPEKYTISKSFRKTPLAQNLKYVMEANAYLDPDKIKTFSSNDMNRMDEKMVQQVVDRYKFKNEKGYGILFIAEGLNKSETTGYFWVTIVDMSNGKVLFTKRMGGKASGFGFRNYWARSVYEILKEIDKKQYAAWKKSFS